MKILVINPGSTSTKLSLYCDREEVFTTNLTHSAEELSHFAKVADQFDFRKEAIMASLKKNDIDINSVEVVIGRGGLCKPIQSGVYKVNKRLLEDLEKGVSGQHASNLGGILAHSIALQIGDWVPAFIADPVVVDEFTPVARISGQALIERASIFHALNQKAIAKRYARQIGKGYDQLNLIVVHMGGGVSVGIHHHGKVVDTNNALDGEGPFSPERAGGVPALALINLCYSGKYDKSQAIKLICGRGGLVSYTGKNSFRDIKADAVAGDAKAKLLVEAFVYQIAKEIGAMAAVVDGKVDAILLTGGIAHNESVTDAITQKVKFIADVSVFPGEDEMGALAANAAAVLRGEEEAKDYS